MLAATQQIMNARMKGGVAAAKTTLGYQEVTFIIDGKGKGIKDIGDYIHIVSFGFTGLNLILPEKKK